MNQNVKIYRLYSHGYEMIVSPYENGWMGFYRERRQQPFITATGKIAELEDAKLAVCRTVENLVGAAHGSTIDPCLEALNEWAEDAPPSH